MNDAFNVRPFYRKASRQEIKNNNNALFCIAPLFFLYTKALRTERTKAGRRLI
jgi:hypothetical protein